MNEGGLTMMRSKWLRGTVLVCGAAGLFAVAMGGCVSSSTYLEMKQAAEDAQRNLQRERQKLQAIEKAELERKKQMEEWLAKLSGAVERLDGMTRSWNDLRVELRRLRIDRELERQAQPGKPGGIGIVIESQGTQPDPQVTTPKPFVFSDDPKLRLKDLLNQLQGVIQESEGKSQ
jgi:TolA-binding protein